MRALKSVSLGDCVFLGWGNIEEGVLVEKGLLKTVYAQEILGFIEVLEVL